MNNRIKELAKEAGGQVWVAYVNPDGDVDDQEMYEKFIGFEPTETLEKFVEFIIEDMYEFIMEENAEDNGIPDLAKIKQYFGVE